MQKSKSVSELIQHSSKALSVLRQRLDERGRLLLRVRAILPARFVEYVLSAGYQDGVLTLGTESAAWASRLRYVAPQLIVKFQADYGVSVEKVRVRVIQSSSSGPSPEG